MNGLTHERALIFRITHIDNVPWILDNGLHCRNSSRLDPNYRDIGNPDLIAKRAARKVLIPPGGTLSDYIPFYFTPYTPMLLNIKTGYGGMKQTPMSEIVIFVSSLVTLTQQGVPFVFTDRHAYLETATYFCDLTQLTQLDWSILQARDFKRDPDDPGKFERYQAEALVYQSLPVTALTGIACYGGAQQASLLMGVGSRGLTLKVVARPQWYF